MRSIKPGRGPSMMGGFMGIFIAVFGVIWTLAAASMGAPFFFCLFGIMFVIIAIVNTIYNFKNATGKNRYSAYDIVEEHEESDPFNERFGSPYYEESRYNGEDTQETEGNEFCPYCGARVEDDFAFCNKCGKKLPGVTGWKELL